jgi:flagellar basal-body rod protein FlgB
MPIEGIFGNTVELLAKTLDLRAKRHELISANLANVETPGYTPSDISFEAELRGALNKSGKAPAPNPRHIPLRKDAASGISRVRGELVEVPDKNVGPDGNSVDLESEMGRMVQNQIMYNTSVQLLSKKMEMMKQAIKGTL